MDTDITFNPSGHCIQIKSQNGTQDYLPVQWRLVWFREKFPQGSIETEMLHLDLDRDTEEEVYVWNAERRRSEKVTKQAKGFAIFRAIVKDGQGGIATGTKSEKAASFPDFIEKAETGSIGRALAALGYGTQFTGDELDAAHMDASQENQQENQQERKEQQERERQEREKEEAERPASEQQLASIRKMSDQLGKEVPVGIEGIDFLSARSILSQLAKELREQKKQPVASTGSSDPVHALQEQAKRLFPNHTFEQVVTHYIFNNEEKYDGTPLTSGQIRMLQLRLNQQEQKVKKQEAS